MKLDFLDEPELEFGAGGRHVDIRFGLMHHGPLDVTSDLAPKKIRVGLVGIPQNIEGLREWLNRCREEIPAKASRQPNLFPKFPGFRPDDGFHSTLVLDPVLEREIAVRTFDRLERSQDANQIVREAVQLFLAEFEYLKEHTPVDVLLCAVPPHLAKLIDPDARPKGGDAKAPQLNFHHMLKAQAMDVEVPIQLVLPGTYDPAARRRQKIKTERIRPLQDDATRAWNIHTALYYKARGVPWRLVRDASQLTTCYVGVSFYVSLDRETLMTSMAQVFDERGEGVVVRGGPVELSKDDRIPHLTAEDALTLLTEALRRYHEMHRTHPARVVVHKTSAFNAAELEGFAQAGVQERISVMDFVSVTDNAVPRLYRHGAYPPLRGTMASLDDREHIVYTRGSVDFYATYPGMYVPRPLLFRCDDTQSTPKQIGREILALTKMNWNKTQFDGSEPITVGAARGVGAILKYIAEGERIAHRYSYYM